MSKFLDIDGLEYYTKQFKPGLAELVDDGLKNIATPKTVTVVGHPNITITQGNGHYEITGTTGTNQLTLYLFNPTVSYLCTQDMFIYPATSLSNIHYMTHIIQTDGTSTFPTIGTTGLYVTTGKQIKNIYVQAKANTIINADINLMVCSKAAWTISHTYQPYNKMIASQSEILDVFRQS